MSPLVSLDMAVGTIVLQQILYFCPSRANVFIKPTNPSLAKNV